MSTSDNLMEYEALGQLPGLLKKLKSNWPVLPSGLWNSSCIQAALRLLHELGRKSKTAGMINVYDLSLAIEKVISDIHEEHEQPDVDEIEKLTQYLKDLSQAIDASESGLNTQNSSNTTYDVLYLPRNSFSGDLICSSIEKNGWRVKQLSDMASLYSALLHQQTDVVLLDTEYLPQIEYLNKACSELKQRNVKIPELIFLSNHCDVEIRLEVLRAGASQCFSEPISVNDLMASIKQVISPELKPCYRVIVVEDDEPQALLSCNLLKKSGFEAIAITDPMSVMTAVQDFQPDLILMDLYMPGANGIELTQLIRARNDACFIPIVFLSGEDDVEKKILALYSGADDFLTKPARPQHLVATVQTRIRRTKEMIEKSSNVRVDAASGLATRRCLLDELNKASVLNSSESRHSALFVVALGEEDGTSEIDYSTEDNSLVSRITDVLNPVIGKRDFIARTGNRNLSVFIKRTLMHDIEQLGIDINQQISNELSHENGTEFRWGIGLVILDSPGGEAYHYLKQGEIFANAAMEQKIEPFLRQVEGINSDNGVSQDISDELIREQVRTALKSGFVQFQEQAYIGSHEAGTIKELIPGFDPSTDLAQDAGDIYHSASQCAGMDILNRLVCQHAVRQLGEAAFRGASERVLVWLSGLAIHDEEFIPFIQSELRRLHVVGTGLIVEFDLPSLAPELKLAKRLLDELSSMGISILLGNFTCNDTAFKVLAYLCADGVRLHPSMLRREDAWIETTLSHIRAMDALVFLPRIDESEKINLHWSEVADYVQVENLSPVIHKPGFEKLGVFE
jgi:DNA-binding response OmpR family regulator/EAL domain-containing protein (putative c-di-GMP-specific phosphodiesterase class I)